jgi:DNA-binding FadR family transcriptional regulator
MSTAEPEDLTPLELREVVYAPVGGEALPQRVVRRIAESISIGLLREGQRLPSEAQLAESLAISPMTLREALAILRQAGYLETVRGRQGGTFVRSGPPAQTAKEVRQAMGGPDSNDVVDIFEVRIAIEGELAALAAERATAEERAQICEWAEMMRDTTDYGTWRPLDNAFHMGIASAARSGLLASRERALRVEISRVIVATFPLIGDHTDPVLSVSNREHLAMAQAIRQGDAEEARTQAITHAEGSRDLILAFLANTDRAS